MVAVSFSGNTDWRRQGMGMGMGIGGVRKECGDDNVASVRDVARGRPGPRRDSGIVGAAETATVLNVLKERERGPQNSPPLSHDQNNIIKINQIVIFIF